MAGIYSEILSSRPSIYTLYTWDLFPLILLYAYIIYTKIPGKCPGKMRWFCNGYNNNIFESQSGAQNTHPVKIGDAMGYGGT